MRPLRPGEAAQLSWPGGAVECRVVAAAGHYVLLRPARDFPAPGGSCSLTYLDGRIPMGWDGVVEPGSHPAELRFRVTDTGRFADRRASVRIPVEAPVLVAVPDDEEQATSEGRVIDVSAGGMRFRRLGRLPKGTTIQLHAELPGGGPVIHADAVVRASEPGICSVEYLAHRGATAADIGAWTVDVLRSALAAAPEPSPAGV